MASRLIARIIAEFNALKAHPAMRRIRPLLDDPHLFHITPHSLSWGMAFGLAANWVPLPVQSLLAVLGCLWKRGNIPLAVALVWLSNPLTLVPMVLLAYHTGAWVLGLPPANIEYEPSWEWLTQTVTGSLHSLLLPFALGSLIWGLISALVGFYSVRFFWQARCFRRLRIVLHRARRAQQARDRAPPPDAHGQNSPPPGEGGQGGPRP